MSEDVKTAQARSFSADLTLYSIDTHFNPLPDDKL